MTSLLLFPAGDAFRAVLVEEMVGCQKGQFDLVAMRQRIAAVLRLQPLAGKLIEALSVPAKVSITMPDGQNDLLNHPGEECFQALVALLTFLAEFDATVPQTVKHRNGVQTEARTEVWHGCHKSTGTAR
jgi:hypothetical protein